MKRFFSWLLGFLVAGGVTMVLGVNDVATALLVTVGAGAIIGEFILGIARALASPGKTAGRLILILAIIIAIFVGAIYVLKGAAFIR